jgi:hypothetical protein
VREVETSRSYQDSALARAAQLDLDAVVFRLTPNDFCEPYRVLRRRMTPRYCSTQ